MYVFCMTINDKRFLSIFETYYIDLYISDRRSYQSRRADGKLFLYSKSQDPSVRIYY